MPTIISTSTQATATQAFNQRKIDRCQDGTLWEFANTGSAAVAPQYSKDNGATWTAATALAGLTNTSLFIDLDDYAHVVWKQSGTTGPNAATLTTDYVYYMRGTPNVGRTAWTWSAAFSFSGDTLFQYPDVIAYRNPASGGWEASCVFSFVNGAGSRACYSRITISSAGVISQSATESDNLARDSTGLLNGTTSGSYYLGVASHTYPSIDFNHTGDGKTVAGGTPHLYVGWTAGRTGAGFGVRFRKAVYAAGAWTWNAEVEIDSTRQATGVAFSAGSMSLWQTCQFDGSRVVIAGQLGGGGSFDLVVYDRDAADTTTVTRTLLTGVLNSANALSSGSTSFDGQGNLYALGVDAEQTGTSGTRKINYRKWTRATATLGPIVTFDATGNDFPYISAKRGYSANSIDWVYTDGTASPYAVTFERIALPPLTPYVPAIML